MPWAGPVNRDKSQDVALDEHFGNIRVFTNKTNRGISPIVKYTGENGTMKKC